MGYDIHIPGAASILKVTHATTAIEYLAGIAKIDFGKTPPTLQKLSNNPIQCVVST